MKLEKLLREFTYMILMKMNIDELKRIELAFGYGVNLIYQESIKFEGDLCKVRKLFICLKLGKIVMKIIVNSNYLSISSHKPSNYWC